MTDEPIAPEAESPEDDEPPKKKRRYGPLKGQAKTPARDVTDRRRELMEKWWVEGCSLAEIRDRLFTETGETWSRPTLTNDLVLLRERWEREGSKRSRAQVKMELERMSRVILDRALKLQKVATRRELGADGKMKVTTVLLPAPDLNAANRAIERIGALHGLNVTTLDGSLSVAGLSDLLAAAAGPDAPEEP